LLLYSQKSRVLSVFFFLLQFCDVAKMVIIHKSISSAAQCVTLQKIFFTSKFYLLTFSQPHS
jgi:hypothetical protein